MTKRITRRQFLSLAASLAAGTVIAACATPPTAAPEPTEAPAATAELAGEAPAEQPALASGGPVEVIYWNVWGSAREPLMNEVCARFNKRYPNITVKNTVMTFDNRPQACAAALASKTPPHVMMSARAETYAYADQDLIINIDPYVELRGLKPDEIFYKAEIDSQRFNGKLWTFPMPMVGGNFTQIFYNKNMFKEAGLDPEKAPKTWSELVTTAKAITQKTDQGLTKMGFNGFGSGNFPAWLYCNAGSYYSADGKKIVFNSPEGVAALEWQAQQITDLYGNVEAMNNFTQGMGDTSKDFPLYTGTMGITLWNLALFGNMKITVPDFYNNYANWGVGLTPYNEANPNAKHRTPCGLDFGWGYVIPKGLPKQTEEAAYLFLEFMCTDPEAGCWFLDQMARPSPVIQCNENPEKAKANPAWPTVLEALQIDEIVPLTPVHSQIHTLLLKGVDEVLFGQQKAQAALDQAAADGQVILDKYWSGAKS